MVAGACDEEQLAPVPAPLDDHRVLFPLLHCLGAFLEEGEEGIPAWAALPGVSKLVRSSVQELCLESPALLNEWRVLQPRCGRLVIGEDFRDTSRWRRHDLKGKTHKLKSTLLRPKCLISSVACHVLALAPVEPPEEFVLDIESHRRLTCVEFSWNAKEGAVAMLQFCKYLKQREAAPAVASLPLTAELLRGNGWRCVCVELDWTRRTFRWRVVDADATGGDDNECQWSAHLFAHDVCDGVRYIKVTDLHGTMAFAHLRLFA